MREKKSPLVSKYCYIYPCSVYLMLFSSEDCCLSLIGLVSSFSIYVPSLRISPSFVPLFSFTFFCLFSTSLPFSAFFIYFSLFHRAWAHPQYRRQLRRSHHRSSRQSRWNHQYIGQELRRRKRLLQGLLFSFFFVSIFACCFVLVFITHTVYYYYFLRLEHSSTFCCFFLPFSFFPVDSHHM